jgi:hypothetical protein
MMLIGDPFLAALAVLGPRNCVALPGRLLRFLVALAPGAGLVTLRQTFVRRCQSARYFLTVWHRRRGGSVAAGRVASMARRMASTNIASIFSNRSRDQQPGHHPILQIFIWGR